MKSGSLRIFFRHSFRSEELEKMVEEAVSEAGAASPKDMGRVMKILMPKVAGRAEGKLVNRIRYERRLASQDAADTAEQRRGEKILDLAAARG